MQSFPRHLLAVLLLLQILSTQYCLSLIDRSSTWSYGPTLCFMREYQCNLNATLEVVTKLGDKMVWNSTAQPPTLSNTTLWTKNVDRFHWICPATPHPHTHKWCQSRSMHVVQLFTIKCWIPRFHLCWMHVHVKWPKHVQPANLNDTRNFNKGPGILMGARNFNG